MNRQAIDQSIKNIKSLGELEFIKEWFTGILLAHLTEEKDFAQQCADALYTVRHNDWSQEAIDSLLWC